MTSRAHLDAVLRTAFSARRKRLDNALKGLSVDWEQAAVDAGSRPDQLSVGDYVRIANALRHTDASGGAGV